MTDRQIRLLAGSLLHDIGKVIYRAGDGRNHSRSGYDFLKEEANIHDSEILSCVLYHHGKNMRNADLPVDSPAYITYFADNIAAAVDRREKDDGEAGFDKTLPLETVFNILNGNQDKKHYARHILDPDAGINYPTDKPVQMDESFYGKVRSNLLDNLKGIHMTDEYINSLLSVLEANLSYVPSSTATKELADISLYDHLKITAAAATCIEQWTEENGISNLKSFLLDNADAAYQEKMFLLYSMDISGIQKFIYTIASKGALKSLRARSFYLEILMEHIIDELLDKVGLSRANLIYSGGGHCYMLLPNTEKAKAVIDEQEKQTNAWFLEQFDVALYIAGGFAECSANDLKNEPEGSYSDLYLKISETISTKKASRYTASQIIRLNTASRKGERECKVCHRMGKTDAENRCPVCAALEDLSRDILNQEFFVINAGNKPGRLPLPGDYYLTAETREQLLDTMRTDRYVRSYSKNKPYTGLHMATKLWVGDYSTRATFDEFAEKAEGIERIGVLRADVDNLGQTFVFGFQRPDGSRRYATLSRTAALSRQLSLFFKFYINQILKEENGTCFGKKKPKNVTIVYSGGDDIFLVGSWNDVVEAFADIRSSLERYAQGTLTISGGIGLYSSGYPVHIMAKETEELEEASKGLDGKNGITLFQKEECFAWPEFMDKVIGEKYRALDEFFTVTKERGNSFLYHLLELIRNQEEIINRARYVYILSRLEPGKDSPMEEKIAYKSFAEKMYKWIDDEQDRRELVLAIYLYVYEHREKVRKDDET